MRPYYEQGYQEPGPQFRFGFGTGWTPGVRKIIILTSICFVLQMLFSARGFGEWFINLLVLVPEEVLRGRVWQLATYVLLHGGLLHILFNMFALWMFGTEVEKALGTQRFVALYIISGVAAGIFNCLFAPASVPVVGASGSVFGVLAAFAMLFPQRKIFLFPFPIPILAKNLVIIFVIINLLSSGSGDGVAHFAHLGGLAFGYVFIKTRSKWEGFLQRVEATRPMDDESDEDITLDDEAEMDRLLDKVKNEGLHKLNWREKRFLDRISQRLRDR